MPPAERGEGAREEGEAGGGAEAGAPRRLSLDAAMGSRRAPPGSLGTRGVNPRINPNLEG